jgi:hypothetical protein
VSLSGEKTGKNGCQTHMRYHFAPPIAGKDSQIRWPARFSCRLWNRINASC